MKKILLSLMALAFLINASAQVARISNHPFKNFSPSRLNKQKLVRDSIGPLYMNYYAFDYLNDTSSSVYTANQGYLLNSRYTEADTTGDFGNLIFDYFVVAFDTFFDYNTGDTYSKADFNSITVDTIIVRAGWEQNTVNNDTTRISVVQLSPKGYPTQVILWDTMILHSLGSTPDDQWNYLADVKVVPHLPPINKKNFGVRVGYYGDKTDTFAFIAGHPLDGSGCPAQLAYFPNSYSYWSAFGFLDPLPNGPGVITNCGGGQTASQIQDIDVGVYVTLQLPNGVDNINPDIAGSYVYPNPAANNTSVNFTLSRSISYSTINIYDITGKMVESYDLKNMTAGKHQQQIATSSMAPGIYMYSITTEQGKTFGKFVKQ